MGHPATAPVDGTVTELTAKAGQQVRTDETLAVIGPPGYRMRIGRPAGKSRVGERGVKADAQLQA